MVVDLFLVYQFIRRLATPFDRWNAFKLGIIDAEGNVLKKRRDLLTVAERQSFGVFDVLVLNLKKLLARLPGGDTRIASYAAALWLIKEHQHFTANSTLNEDTSDDVLLETLKGFVGYYETSDLTRHLVGIDRPKPKRYEQLLTEVTR